MVYLNIKILWKTFLVKNLVKKVTEKCKKVENLMKNYLLVKNLVKKVTERCQKVEKVDFLNFS